MSLRDQLLKSGLANKQQAKKASRAAKKAEHAKRKAQTGGAAASDVEGGEDLSAEIQKKQQLMKERDRQLNLEIEQQRRLREQTYRAAEIIVSRDLLEANNRNTTPYYFVVDGKVIHSIPVTDYQQAHLEEGRMAIATLHDDRYYLLELDDCLQILDLKPDYIVCFHQDPAH
ncbi:MAG: DUF2058 family protein [Oligoflexus sp.]